MGDPSLRRADATDTAPESATASLADAEPAADTDGGGRGGGAPVLGEHLGQFRVEARIGAGGLGVVYRAYDEKLRRQVALKVLADGAARVDRLLAEARSAAALTHASIAAIYDVQQVNGVAFLVMELVEGRTLREQMAQGARLPVDRALALARQLADALGRAHAMGIVHRDVKPENIIVTAEGTAKMLDFGLARDAGTGSGASGTRSYMSPEQALGRAADPRSDVFSFGVVFYEMLGGERPFVREERDPRLWGDAEWTVRRPLRSLAPEVPVALEKVVRRCLERDAAARFADGRALAEALGPMGQVVPGRRGRSRRLEVAVAAGCALLAGAVGLVSHAWVTPPAAARVSTGAPFAVPAVAPAPAPDREPPVIVEAAGQRWEVIDGDWRADGDELVGRSGHVQTTGDVGDATLSLDERALGSPVPTVGIGFHYSLAGGDPRAQCGYGFNIRDREVASFAGDKGDWGPVSHGYRPAPALHPGSNHVVVRIRGAHVEVELNGALADSFDDAQWPRGRMNLWASRSEARFAHVTITAP